MKTSTKFILFLTLLLALAVPGSAFARQAGAISAGDEVVFGGSFTLQDGETLDGNLIVFGGNASLEDGSQVNGDVVVMGGNVQGAGEINGNILAFGGNINLTETAVVTGDVSTVGGNLDRDPGAQIQGEVNSDLRGTFPFFGPSVQVGGVERFSPFRLFANSLWFLFRTFLWAALAVLVILFLPRHVERTAQAAVHTPLVSGGVGLLTVAVAIPVLVIVAITIIGIPVSLLAILALVVAWALGMVSIGYEVGRRLAQALNQTWAPAVAAGVGTFLLMLITNGIGAIDCIGWVVPFLVGIIALGAAVLTRFGTAFYPPLAPAGRAAPPAPAGPFPPHGDWPPAPPVQPVAPVEPVEAATVVPPASPLEVSPVSPAGVYPAPEAQTYVPPATVSVYPVSPPVEEPPTIRLDQEQEPSPEEPPTVLLPPDEARREEDNRPET